MEVGLGPGDFVLDGDPAPLRKKGAQFSAHVCCSQTAGWIRMAFGMDMGDIVLDGDPPSPPLKGHNRYGPFLAHICCGQMAGWIKMPLGMEVGLVPGDFVLDRDPAPPPRKGGRTPNLWPMSIVAKRLDRSR